MKKSVTKKTAKTDDTVARTIEVDEDTFEKISKIAKENNTDLNSAINQLVEYTLKHLDKK